MLELTARITVASAYAPPGSFPVQSARVTIDEIPLAGIFRIQGPERDETFCSRVAAAARTPLPGPGECFADAGTDGCLVWSGPGEWLYFCPLAQEAARLALFERACESFPAVVTLISDSRVAFRVAGPEATSLLAKGCALDLEHGAFPAGRAATTRFAGLPGMLVHRVAGEYLLYFDVSYSEYLMTWWLDAADEFRAPAV